jgi:hypothetical protein
MADQSDVEAILVGLAAGALYPQGTAAPSLCARPVRIYRGWPNPPALDASLAAGEVNVTVSAVDDAVRNTTRYAEHWAAQAPPAALTIAVSGESVTLGGTAAAGQLAGIAASGNSYVYRTATGDTPELVAANLAEQARADFIVTLADTTLTLAGAADIIARVVADAASIKELRRQSQRFRIACWCDDPVVRDTVATSIDVALAGQRFVALPDGTTARLCFVSTTTLDQSQDAALYRRDLLYDVEYATAATAVQPAMLFGMGRVNRTSSIS